MLYFMDKDGLAHVVLSLRDGCLFHDMADSPIWTKEHLYSGR